MLYKSEQIIIGRVEISSKTESIEPLVTMCFLGGMWCMVCEIRGETVNREHWPQPSPLNFSKIDSTQEDVPFTQSKPGQEIA